MQAYEESVRQTIRQQAKLLEKGLAEWYSAQPSLKAASQAWDAMDPTHSGFADASMLMTTNGILGYLNTESASGGSNYTSSSVSTYSPEMARCLVKTGASPSFIGGDTNSDTSLNFAHVRFYWTVDDTTTPSINERTQTSPKVILFLPAFN